MKFCVLIPVFNGAKTIESLIREIKAFTSNIIIVDDGSVDGTPDVAERLKVTVISHPENKGKGASLKTGFGYILKNTDFEYVIIMDADGQHNPRFIANFLEAARESQADIIIGNRMENAASMPLVRRLTNRTMSFIISRIARQNIPDTQCGYRLLRRRVIEKIKLETSKYDTESEIIFKGAKQHFKFGSVKIPTIYRGQKSNINPFVDTFRFVKLLLRLILVK